MKVTEANITIMAITITISSKVNPLLDLFILIISYASEIYLVCHQTNYITKSSQLKALLPEKCERNVKKKGMETIPFCLSKLLVVDYLIASISDVTCSIALLCSLIL